jgi:hypothetical protein
MRVLMPRPPNRRQDDEAADDLVCPVCGGFHRSSDDDPPGCSGAPAGPDDDGAEEEGTRRRRMSFFRAALATLSRYRCGPFRRSKTRPASGRRKSEKSAAVVTLVSVAVLCVVCSLTAARARAISEPVWFFQNIKNKSGETAADRTAACQCRWCHLFSIARVELFR